MIQHRVHHGVLAEQLHLGVLTVKELESLLRKVPDAVLLRLRHGLFRQDRRHLVDPIHPEGGDLPVLIRPAHDVVKIAVPGQRVGAEGVGLSAVFELPVLPAVVLEVQKAHLAL